LNVPHPRCIGVQGVRSLVLDLEVMGQPGVDGDPGNSRGRVRVVGGSDRLGRRLIGSLPRRFVVFERRDIAVGIPDAHPLVIPRDRG
jgi:hypothetical protein